jgi:hypothetical protein
MESAGGGVSQQVAEFSINEYWFWSSVAIPPWIKLNMIKLDRAKAEFSPYISYRDGDPSKRVPPQCR